VQRTWSDLRLNPHLHVVFLDGAYRERDGELVWRELSRLTTEHVASVLEATLRRIDRHLRRRGGLPASDGLVDADQDGSADQEANLVASAVSGRTPPAGPMWQRGLPQLVGKPLALDKHLCASMDGFTLHAATRAGAQDFQGREALLRYVLRPAIAQERVEQRPDGLVRITLKRAFGDGTVAVDMDPLSLVARLAAAVPPPRFPHRQVRWRARVGAQVACAHRAGEAAGEARCPGGGAARATREAEAPRCTSTLGRAARAHLCDRRAPVSEVQRADEARRDGDRPEERARLPAAHRRALRRARAQPQPRPAVLEEHRAAPQGARRRRRRRLGVSDEHHAAPQGARRPRRRLGVSDRTTSAAMVVGRTCDTVCEMTPFFASSPCPARSSAVVTAAPRGATACLGGRPAHVDPLGHASAGV